MTTDDSKADLDSDSTSLQLSPAQLAFLNEAASKVDRSAINRPFRLAGQAPEFRLERKGLEICTAVSPQDLLALARAGYLSYRSQERQILFREKLLVAPGASQDDATVSTKYQSRSCDAGPRQERRSLLRPLRIVLLAGAVLLAILYIVGVTGAIAIQTWATIGGLVVATLALSYQRRDRR